MGRKSKTTKAWWPAVRKYLQNRRDNNLPLVTSNVIIAEAYMIGSYGTAAKDKLLCQSRMCPTQRELSRWLADHPDIISIKEQRVQWGIKDEN
tara:strand:+ start:374 stop:652 length:279 start_codon:yes stop_codon:yes gene_type:complete